MARPIAERLSKRRLAEPVDWSWREMLRLHLLRWLYRTGRIGRG